MEVGDNTSIPLPLPSFLPRAALYAGFGVSQWAKKLKSRIAVNTFSPFLVKYTQY